MSDTLFPTSFLTPDSISPAAAAYDGFFVYTVNGMDPFVFVFTPQGEYVRRFRTLRPYRAVRYDKEQNTFCCVGGGCRGDVYLLNERFEETAYIEIESYGSDGERYIADAAQGEDGLLYITRPHSIDVYSPDGGYIYTSARSGAGREFLRSAETQSYNALYYLQNGEYMLTVNGEGGALRPCVELRSFIPAPEGLYGAFAVRYLYTYIAPVFAGDTLDRAVFGDFCALWRANGKCCAAKRGK